MLQLSSLEATIASKQRQDQTALMRVNSLMSLHETTPLMQDEQSLGGAPRLPDCNDHLIGVDVDGILSGDGAFHLYENVSVAGKVMEDDYVYYRLCVQKHNHVHRVRIDLTAHSGDPDMYISTTIPKPRKEGSTWISADIGSDTIVLSSDLPDWDSESNSLYISVYGRTESTYDLKASISIQKPLVTSSFLRKSSKRQQANSA